MVAGAVDGAGIEARFNYPSDIAIDTTSGALYVADLYNFIIRKVTPDGLVTTLAGQAGESDRIDGPVRVAKFESPSAVAVDHSGNVYVADTVVNCIRRINHSRRVTTIAGQPGYIAGRGNGRGEAAQFSHPFGLATDAGGNVYVADLENNAIRRIAADGTVATVANFASQQGDAAQSGSDAGPGKPFRIALDRAGNLYATDIVYSGIRKGTPGPGVPLESSPQSQRAGL
jgi:DNA-binding beta-propeller fold protein YncE